MKRSPLGLDLYLWLTYRTFGLKRPLRLTWPLLYRQFGVDPARANDKFTIRNFRTDCLRELKKNQGRLAGPALSHGHRGARALAAEQNLTLTDVGGKDVVEAVFDQLAMAAEELAVHVDGLVERVAPRLVQEAHQRKVVARGRRHRARK